MRRDKEFWAASAYGVYEEVRYELKIRYDQTIDELAWHTRSETRLLCIVFDRGDTLADNMRIVKYQIIKKSFVTFRCT